MSRVLLSTAIAVGASLLTISTGFTADTAAGDPGKSIFPRTAASTTASSLQLMVVPTQDSFRIDEPIRFKVVGSDKFYLYIYSVEDGGKAAKLILAPSQAKDSFERGKMYEDVPKEGFAATKSGTERVVFVASRKYIPLSEASAGAPAGATSEKALEQQFQEKGLVLRPAAPNPDLAVQRLQLKITGTTASTPTQPVHPPAPGSADSGHAAAIPFVAVDHSQYNVGDTVRVVYGATEAGYIHLFIVEPSGKATLWQKKPVEAGKAYTSTTHATNPSGDHTLIAAFTTDGRGDVDISSSVAATAAAGQLDGKGLAPPDASSAPTAVYHFVIRDGAP